MTLTVSEGTHLKGMRIFVLLIVAANLAGLIYWLNAPGSELQSYQKTGLPFGCIADPGKGYSVQDFAYNLTYFHSIHDRVVTHPYRQEDQEKLILNWLPTSTSGMTHAYSPVGYVLSQPLLWVSAAHAYLLYSLVSALSLLLLYWYYLLPRAESRLQIYGLLIFAVSITMLMSFAMGQSALITTPLLGLFWNLLQRRGPNPKWTEELLLAIVFWSLCMKPSIAMIPFTLLVGRKAWPPLALASLFLVVTWLSVYSLYGGFVIGLQDYSFLINHYYQDAMIPFMREVFAHHDDAGADAYFSTMFPGHSGLIFTINRVLFLVISLGLLALRLAKAISSSVQFQGMIWNFLLFCPYLLRTEDCILCLLIVEGTFFQSKGLLIDGAKLLLLLGVMNLRIGVIVPWQINFPITAALMIWIVLEGILKWRRG